jgi:hypothetical protein
MTITTIKITELDDIGADLDSDSVFPVVNMTGTPVTEKTVLSNIANVILQGAGIDYSPVAVAARAGTVTTAAQPNITSTGTLTSLTVTGNIAGGNILATTLVRGTTVTAVDQLNTANLSANGLATIASINVTNTANLGGVGNITITGGSNGQVLTTNGTGSLSWTTVSSGNSSYGNSDVANYLPTFTGNIGANVVTANLFSGNGANLTNIAGANVSGFVPNANVANTAFAVAAANVSGLGNIATINLDGNASNVLRGDGTFGADANNSYGNSNVVTLLSAFGSNTITTTGNVSVGNITATNLGNIVSANLDGNVSNLLTGNGTYVAIPVVPTVGNIATINLDGSNSNVLYGNGVFAAVAGGNANTGNVTFNDINIIGTGNLNLQPNSATSESLDIYLTAADDIHIAGSGNIILGTDEQANVAVLTNGNVAIQAGNVGGTQTWNFGTDGNLTLPRGGVVYETNIPDGGLNGNTIALTPSGGTNADQQLLIYPTTNDANHLHLTSGNLYSTELFLGDDNLYVKLANTGNIVINSNDDAGNTAQWTFGTDGALTLPIGISIDYNGNVQYPKIIADSGKLFSVQGQGNTGSAALAWTVDPNAASQYAAVSVSRGGGDDLA